jgi:hypothetical protein
MAMMMMMTDMGLVTGMRKNDIDVCVGSTGGGGGGDGVGGGWAAG